MMHPKATCYVFLLLLLMACGSDNQVGSEFTESRIIKNSSSYSIELNLFSNANMIQTTLEMGDSIVFSADCEVRGDEKGCDYMDSNFTSVEAFEDSIQVIFNTEKILRFKREEIGSCCSRNMLRREAQWGYEVTGEATSVKTYTFTITDEDYGNAESFGG